MKKEVRTTQTYASHFRLPSIKFFQALIAITLLFLAVPSWAALGDNEQSIERDAVRMKGMRRVVQASDYSMHEIQAPSGYTVREYVSSGGSVFAVSWSGPGGLDLRSLLGAYFEEFRQNVAARSSAAQRPLLMNSPGLVFEQSGHMRAIRGRAYVPALLPAGVDPNEIQ
jgi:hypothetical protein